MVLQVTQLNGVLEIQIVRGHGLKNADMIGLSDPYAVASLNGRELTRTPVMKDSCNPTWNHEASIHLSGETTSGDFFKIDIFDHDMGKSDDYLGSAIIPMEKVFHSKDLEFQGLMNLYQCKTFCRNLDQNHDINTMDGFARAAGDITVSLKYIDGRGPDLRCVNIDLGACEKVPWASDYRPIGPNFQ